ncbi:glycoside hydrolase superfamily, partial [Lactarius hengduanensis]
MLLLIRAFVALSACSPLASPPRYWKHFPGDSWSDPGVNLYGCLKQLYLLKLANRNLKVLLSIGGWTYSQSGHFSFVTNPSLRATFVSSAIQLIKDGFDGIDIDFEYPSSTAQGQGFADLLTELRTAMNALANSNGDTVPYQLTAAVAAGAANYASLVVPQMNSALTYWNLMAYDYAGSWLTWADNQANLYGGARTNVSTDAAVQWYLSKGATASKINMGKIGHDACRSTSSKMHVDKGIPLYG